MDQKMKGKFTVAREGDTILVGDSMLTITGIEAGHVQLSILAPTDTEIVSEAEARQACNSWRNARLHLNAKSYRESAELDGLVRWLTN